MDCSENHTYLFIIEDKVTHEEIEKRVITSSESWAWELIEKYLAENEEIKSCEIEY